MRIGQLTAAELESRARDAASRLAAAETPQAVAAAESVLQELETELARDRTARDDANHTWELKYWPIQRMLPWGAAADNHAAEIAPRDAEVAADERAIARLTDTVVAVHRRARAGAAQQLAQSYRDNAATLAQHHAGLVVGAPNLGRVDRQRLSSAGPYPVGSTVHTFLLSAAADSARDPALPLVEDLRIAEEAGRARNYALGLVGAAATLREPIGVALKVHNDLVQAGLASSTATILTPAAMIWKGTAREVATIYNRQPNDGLGFDRGEIAALFTAAELMGGDPANIQALYRSYGGGSGVGFGSAWIDAAKLAFIAVASGARRTELRGIVDAVRAEQGVPSYGQPYLVARLATNPENASRLFTVLRAHAAVMQQGKQRDDSIHTSIMLMAG